MAGRPERREVWEQYVAMLTALHSATLDCHIAWEWNGLQGGAQATFEDFHARFVEWDDGDFILIVNLSIDDFFYLQDDDNGSSDRGPNFVDANVIFSPDKARCSISQGGGDPEIGRAMYRLAQSMWGVIRARIAGQFDRNERFISIIEQKMGASNVIQG